MIRQRRLLRIARELVAAGSSAVYEGSFTAQEFKQIFKEQLSERFFTNPDADLKNAPQIEKEIAKKIESEIIKNLPESLSVRGEDPEPSAESGGCAFDLWIKPKDEQKTKAKDVWVSVAFTGWDRENTEIIIYYIHVINGLASYVSNDLVFRVPAHRASGESWQEIGKRIADNIIRNAKKTKIAMMPSTDGNKTTLFKMELRNRSNKKIEECLMIEKALAKKFVADMDKLGFVSRTGSSGLSPWIVSKKKTGKQDIDWGWGPRVEMGLFTAYHLGVPVGIEAQVRVGGFGSYAETKQWVVALENDEISAKRIIEFFDESFEKMKK
jgi:hypothetical protein